MTTFLVFRWEDSNMTCSYLSLCDKSLYCIPYFFQWETKPTSSLGGPSPSSQWIKASVYLHMPANQCCTHKNHYFSWGGKRARIVSVVFKKQHVILWCWKFHEKVRGKLENVLWSLVVQAEDCTFCLHTDYWGTTSSSWINPKVHCEPQPKPWVFSQV